MDAQIRHAALDGNPVRYTDTEAWMLADGEWRQIHPAEVFANAQTLTAMQYTVRFPDAAGQALPYTAFHSGGKLSVTSA